MNIVRIMTYNHTLIDFFTILINRFSRNLNELLINLDAWANPTKKLVLLCGERENAAMRPKLDAPSQSAYKTSGGKSFEVFFRHLCSLPHVSCFGSFVFTCILSENVQEHIYWHIELIVHSRTCIVQVER